MTKIDCPKFDDCSAPLCPLQQNTMDGGIWYPDEEICRRRDFQNLPWISKQKAIVKAKAPSDRYFTVQMLEAIKQVRKGIEGIDPDQPLEEALKAEKKWVLEHQKVQQVIAKQNQKPQRVIAGVKKNLVGATPYMMKGGEK